MDPFCIAVTGWGLFIQIRKPLTNNDRNAFAELLMSSLRRAQTAPQRNLLLDLRAIDVTSDPGERIEAYASIARLMDTQRFAVVVSSPSGAARFEKVLGSDVAEDCRILVVGAAQPNALAPALAWIGTAPDDR